VAVALLVTVGLLAYNLHQSNIRYMKLASEKTALNTQSSQQNGAERLESNLPKESHVVTPPPLGTPPAPTLPQGAATEGELAKVRTDRAAALARSKVLEDQLTKVAAELEALRLQSEQTSLSRDQLEKKLKEAEQVATAVKNDLQEIRQARTKDSLTIGAQDL